MKHTRTRKIISVKAMEDLIMNVAKTICVNVDLNIAC